jgi:MOSC domain-containing protein YiiM
MSKPFWASFSTIARPTRFAPPVTNATRSSFIGSIVLEADATGRNHCTMPGVITQINISDGGMPKLPVTQAMVTVHGVAGDRQRNLKFHGGPNRAVCLYSEELYEWLRESCNVNVTAGQIGENFTTRGLDLGALQPGDRLRAGECVIEITKARVPCHQLKMWDEDLPELIVGRSGWVAKVIEEGHVRAGNAIEKIDRSTIPST